MKIPLKGYPVYAFVPEWMVIAFLLVYLVLALGFYLGVRFCNG